jgi:inorganic triphosphatase YgiF
MTRNPRGAMQSVSVELELKLISRSKDLAALYDSSFIVAHARGQPSDRSLKTAYYDTTDQALHRAGMTLRVRCEGQTFVQTLKAASLKGGPMRRREWQAPVPTMDPVPSALADRLPKALRSVLGANGLRPIFTTTFRRRQRVLDISGASVEVAFDQGVIEAGDHRVPISEIELELKSGAPAALYELALQLRDHHAFKVGGQSKADRGYALALNAAPVSANAPPTILDPEKAIGEAFAQIFLAAHAHVLANQAAAEDGRDPEGVHQMRVGLRRLRSALSLLRPIAPSPTLEVLRADAEWAASCLDDARGWDVFLAETLPEAAAGCAGDGWDRLKDAAEALRAQAYAKVRETLSAERHTRFHLTLGAWIERRAWQADGGVGSQARFVEATGSFAARALSERHRKVLKRGKHFRSLTPEARHQLRLAVKKLRYAADFFLTALGHPRIAKRYLHRLGELQDQLGRYNDMAVTSHLLEQLLETAPDASARQAADVILSWQERGLIDSVPTMLAAWRTFCEAEPPWPHNASDANETDSSA